MRSAAGTDAPPARDLAWRPSFRIVSSRFPPVGLFDAIADPADLEALYEIEGLTNPRLREELGQIRLVPPEQRIIGPGTTPVMAAFTHPNPDGSRWSDGRYGVYYAAADRATAIAETVYHREIFLRATAEPPCVLEMRSYLADIAGRFNDARGGWPELHDPVDYAASQRLGRALHAAGADGVAWDSVRHAGGTCIAAFRPDRIGPARQGEHFHYHWDGHAIAHVVVASEILHLR